MPYQIIAVLLYGLAMLHGWMWSVSERRKAVQAAYDEIRDEVRRECANAKIAGLETPRRGPAVH
ncbi:MAG TPA: hypothetical protein VE994_18750 [Terriglobales bacterium]|nr:hypothetical protein [Terriglobales bacterium]